ncbi:MAG: IS1182 family transposase [Armatimonadetes bacterium]|nr:IS1182 family transposase [Armatimonadota bacterium]
MQHEPRPEQQSLLDDYYVRELVPEDHPLLEIDRAVDFSFVRELVRGLYSDRLGRPAVDPELLLRLCFLQSYYGLSDREVIARAQTDLALRRFLHLAVDEELPHPSLLSIFRRRVGVERFREIFNASVRQAVERGLVSGRLLMVDSFSVAADVAVGSFRGMVMRLVRRGLRLMEAAGEETGRLRKERAALEADNSRQQSVQLRDLELASWMALAGQVREGLRGLESRPGGVGERARRLGRVIEGMLRRTADRPDGHNKEALVSDVDPDARWGRRGRGKEVYAGYKEQVAVDADQEIVTTVQVTPANVDDKAMLVAMVGKAEETTGRAPEAVVADKGYSSGEARQWLEEKGIADLVAAPAPKGSTRGRLTVQDFQVDWDEEGKPVGLRCPAGHEASGGKWHKAQRGWVFYFHRSQCRQCPHRPRCTEGRRGRVVFIGEHHRALRRAREQATDASLQAAQKRRLNIERTFAFQKRRSRLDRARYRGLAGVSIQAYLSCFMTNLVRIAKAAAGAAAPPFATVPAYYASG